MNPTFFMVRRISGSTGGARLETPLESEQHLSPTQGPTGCAQGPTLRVVLRVPPLLSPSPGSILSWFETSLERTSSVFYPNKGRARAAALSTGVLRGREEGKGDSTQAEQSQDPTGTSPPARGRWDHTPPSSHLPGHCGQLIWHLPGQESKKEQTLPEAAFPCFSHVIFPGEAGNYRGAGAELAAGQSESSASLVSGTGMSDSGTRSWFQSRCGSVSTMQGRAKSVSRE